LRRPDPESEAVHQARQRTDRWRDSQPVPKSANERVQRISWRPDEDKGAKPLIHAGHGQRGNTCGGISDDAIRTVRDFRLAAQKSERAFEVAAFKPAVGNDAALTVAVTPEVEKEGVEAGGAEFLGQAEKAGPRLADHHPGTTWVLGELPAGEPQAISGLKADRLASGDPRPSIEERYGNIETYTSMLQNAINNLVRSGFLLPFDADAALKRNLDNVARNNLLSKK